MPVRDKSPNNRSRLATLSPPIGNKTLPFPKPAARASPPDMAQLMLIQTNAMRGMLGRKLTLLLVTLAVLTACSWWVVTRLSVKRDFMAKIKGTACLQVTGTLPVSIDKRREVDGICCDANRIALLSKLLEDKVRVTAIRRWGSNQNRNATTSVHLEVCAVTEGSKERLFVLVASGLLHLDRHSYIETERDLDETIVSLLQIPVHEVPIGHASSSWKLPADAPRPK